MRRTCGASIRNCCWPSIAAAAQVRPSIPRSSSREIAQELVLNEKLFLDAAGPSPNTDDARTTIASRLTAARTRFLDRLQSDPYFADATSVREAIQLRTT